MTSIVDTSVKNFGYDFPGAPELHGTFGSEISVHTACLVTGFGLRSVVSLVVASGVATLTLASNSKNVNLMGSVVLVEGASVAALNGEQRVTAATSTTLKFGTAAADGTATGTITVKTAPAGYELVFSAPGKAVYKSLAPESLGGYFRVQETDGSLAVDVRSYVTMSDVDTGTGKYPPDGISDWAKAYQPSSPAGPAIWDIFADDRLFYYCPSPGSSYSASYPAQACWYWGDYLPAKSGDAWATGLSSSASAGGTYTSYGSVPCGNPGRHFGARGYTGLGAGVALFRTPEVGSDGTTSGLDDFYGAFPPPTDGKLRLSRILVKENSGRGANTIQRGVFPGIYHVPHRVAGGLFARGDILQGPPGVLSGRRLRAIELSTSNYADARAAISVAFFDTTGPWR